MTATIQLPADYVLSLANGRISEMEERMAAAREAKILDFMQKPVRRGHLWWSYDHYRTRAEAEADYSAPCDRFCGNAQYRTERDFKHTIRALEPLTRLAESALEASQQFVTVDAGDCYLLGTPRRAA